MLAKGGVERIGAAESPWKIEICGKAATSGATKFADYGAAIAHVEAALHEGALESFHELAAVGFKPVMAKNISGTQVMDEKVLGAMEALYTLLPAHNPCLLYTSLTMPRIGKIASGRVLQDGN